MTNLTYHASPTASQFHRDNNFVRLIIGCLGSGKSVACSWEIYMRALAQRPNDQGRRKSRWLIVRNTLPQLETTTMNTWKDWFGPRVFDGADISGRAPYKQLIEHPLPDGTTLALEVIFLALDSEEDVGKLLSLECTGIWFNEFREITKPIFEAATGRVGRYPRAADGGCTWHGIIADTNPPDDGHWVYKMVEEERPSNVSVYKQPSGLAQDAENLGNLPPLYYENMCVGKTQEWINVYVHGKYGYIQEGKTVYDGVWNDDYHYSRTPVNLIPGRLLIGGIDASGRSPAAVIIQQTADGQLQVIWELCGEDVGAVAFSRLLRQEISVHFPQNNIRWWGDPAGAFKTQNDERTYFEILRGEGIVVQPSPGFRTNERIEAMNSILSRNIGGKPALIVGPACNRLRKGFNGGYRYKKIGSSGNARYTPDPEKNEYSHCFVGDTLVSTPYGKKKIKNIKVGDMVLTPLGERKVTDKLIKQSNVVDVIVNNKTITCTPDHKFATPYGYSPAEVLQYANVITEDMKWAGKVFIKLKNLQELNSIKNQTGITKPITQKAAITCTDLFGNFTTERYRTSIIYTTLTRISRIIGWKTYSLYAPNNMCLSTPDKGYYYTPSKPWRKLELPKNMQRYG